jgi:hypothetical protein
MEPSIYKPNKICNMMEYAASALVAAASISTNLILSTNQHQQIVK